MTTTTPAVDLICCRVDDPQRRVVAYSTVVKCERCPSDVSISRSLLTVKAAQPAARIICLQCATAEHKQILVMVPPQQREDLAEEGLEPAFAHGTVLRKL